MSAGDISKKLVSQIRDKLNDQSRELVKTDNDLYTSLTHYQEHIMTTYLTTRVKVEYPLIADQSEYPIADNVLSITKVEFNTDIALIPKVTMPDTTSGDDDRVIILEESDGFITGTDLMTVWAFISPLDADAITKDNDPLLEKAYHYFLNQCVLSEYRHLFPQFMALEDVERRIDKLSRQRKATNRAIVRPVFRSGINL